MPSNQPIDVSKFLPELRRKSALLLIHQNLDEITRLFEDPHFQPDDHERLVTEIKNLLKNL